MAEQATSNLKAHPSGGSYMTSFYKVKKSSFLGIFNLLSNYSDDKTSVKLHRCRFAVVEDPEVRVRHHQRQGGGAAGQGSSHKDGAEGSRRRGCDAIRHQSRAADEKVYRSPHHITRRRGRPERVLTKA